MMLACFLQVTYCDPDYYLTRPYVGYTASFVPVAQVDYRPTRTHGYVGYQPSVNAIFVSFRGTEGSSVALLFWRL
jgi:hypothetical protein